MLQRIFAALLLLTTATLSAQYADIPYRSRSNPNYWKNRAPYPGYWQQDVHYRIKAVIDDATDVINASEELTYWNNSPDTLTFVYFHLYQNAFQPGSYTDDLHRNNNFPTRYGKYEKQGLGTTVNGIKVDGQDVRTELDNTILKVWLPKPLRPGFAVRITMDFKTYFDNGGNIRRRMKMYQEFGYKHYDGVHWYPRISVYDRKAGWDTDQHLTREFYGDFGVYDVELTFPNHYVMDATGELVNEAEVLPADLRQKLDIANFAKKPWGTQPSTVIASDGSSKTWKFHAENVHDFAWTADPSYRIGEVKWNGIRCIALAQEQHCSGWQDAAAFTAKVIETYSTDFGMYAYPKMIVADARDGMEYPMLTLDGGRAPDYYDLIAHEVGHNWFFGMVGSNETYRAMLDEGFTQFLTAWSYRKLKGDVRLQYPYRSKYAERFREPDMVVESECMLPYTIDAVRGEEAVLETHSDHFGGALRHGGGYRQVYMKTATMLYNLQYVLGDELFLKSMQHYFNQWKFAHPYVEDFRNSVIQYTHVDLNWFFDQWLNTAKTIDYGVKGIKRGDSASTYLITFERYGMQMPIDFTVRSNEGKEYNYHIPNTWFVKQTSATVLPRWIGWDNIQKTYQAEVVIPSGIAEVMIDTTHRMADVNMLNNSSKLPVDFRFDSKIYNQPSRMAYALRARPDFWYNGFDGVKAGFYLGGDYLATRHIFDLWFHYNTGIGQSQLPEGADFNLFDQFSVQLNYRTPMQKLVKNSSFFFTGRHLDGLNLVNTGFELQSRNLKHKFTVAFKMMQRADSSDLNYLIYRNEWTPDRFNNSVNLGYEHPYSYKRGNGVIQLNLRSTALGSDYDYQYAQLNVVNKNDLGKININTRLFAQAGTGLNWASESMLYLAGANPEQLMESKYTRSMGFFPVTWSEFGDDINHFHAGGGLGLRGYAGYVVPQFDWYGDLRRVYKGTTGAAFNMELEFQELFGFIGRAMPRVKSVIGLQSYLFGDVGAINFNTGNEPLAMSDFRADAGVGFALTIKRFPPLQTVKPLTLRVDFPLFLNRTPFVSPDYLQLRWVVGVSRAF